MGATVKPWGTDFIAIEDSNLHLRLTLKAFLAHWDVRRKIVSIQVFKLNGNGGCTCIGNVGFSKRLDQTSRGDVESYLRETNALPLLGKMWQVIMALANSKYPPFSISVPIQQYWYLKHLDTQFDGKKGFRRKKVNNKKS